MDEQNERHHIIDLAPGRRLWLNILDLPRPKLSMFGLLEVDVTVVRDCIAKYKARTGETLSFTGYLTYCLARAVEADKIVQSYRKGHHQLILFDEVNVGLMIERQVGERRAVTGYVVRDASHKSYLDIHREIRAAQSTPVSGRQMPGWFRSAMLLPWPLSRLVVALFGMAVRRDPTIHTSMAGTVGITAVGMFGKGHSGWGLETTRHSLDLIVGSTAWKPAVVDGQIVPRQILNLTLVFDHHVIDGAPAARFTQRLLELIENGEGLSELEMPAHAEEARVHA